MQEEKVKIGVLGGGTMGAGIAQTAAFYGHKVVLCDASKIALETGKAQLESLMSRMVAKGKIDSDKEKDTLRNIYRTNDINDLGKCDLVIEAIVENLEIKQKVFKQLEEICFDDTILASNTSSLSIASIAGSCGLPERIMGIHFFNPAFLMPLVEIVPGIQTSEDSVKAIQDLIGSWEKTTVLAKDTPGFIVNRVARPFYGEAIRIFEEGIADFATIDYAMKHVGGFRMGPFELMDYIGNDINYMVTETVFKEFFYEPRYKPSFTQKRLVESKRYGRKSGQGYFDYREGAQNSSPDTSEGLSEQIFNRILCMLVNEAADTLFYNIANKEDIDLAMTKGVNYPKGLLKWADEVGLDVILKNLEALQFEYGEDRYRPSPLLRRMVKNGNKFY